MADELKDISDSGDNNNEGQSQDKGQDNSKPDERSDRTRMRIEDLSEKVRSANVALEEERKARKNAEFELGFEKVSKQFPLAPEVKDNVRKLFDAGLPVEDATIAELHKAGKLQNSQQRNEEKVLNEAMGGSADTRGVDRGKKSISEMSQSEKRAKLIEMEQSGEIYVS